MNLSDSDDDSSSDGGPTPSKRPRADTFEASSTTSHGSVLQESDDEHAETANPVNIQTVGKSRRSLSDRSPRENLRLSSRSSLSENCSSPNEEYDSFRPGFDDNDDTGEPSMRPTFLNSNDMFYNKPSQQYNDSDAGLNTGYSETSKRIMKGMGYKPGKGLGKLEHGRVDPVEASTQKGRRGLGLKPSIVGEVPADFQWAPDDSKAEVQEPVYWMPPPPDEPLSGDILEEWLRFGAKKLTINDETEFVQPEVLKGVLDAKTCFDSLDDEDLRHARFRSNPYETIGSVIFLNRAAVKMANMDAVFDYMFTSPKKPNGDPEVRKNDLLYFADVCAGPGGFSEYVLYRKGWKAKGFGFTLRGSHDFKLSDFYAGTPETFNPFYGTKGDGNVFDPENLTSLKKEVLKNTEDKGVHFLMADGGFSVEGQENIQEILSKQLYLCQCLAALMLVRTGGNFVVKLFDAFTLFSVGLIYIMYRCFDKVCIHKPVTSRPANSERYLVCQRKRLETESAENHLFYVNTLLSKFGDNEDVTELVPLDVIKKDVGFFEYIYKSNTVLGEKQIKNLAKIAAFSKNKGLKEASQAAVRKECLKFWMLPDKVRTQPERTTPDDTLNKILGLLRKSSSAHDFKTNVLNKPPKILDKPETLSVFKSVYDWYFMFLSGRKSNSSLRYILGCGDKQVYQLEGTQWRILAGLNLTLPPKTLIYGEILKEYTGQGGNQLHNKALHIIDAIMLGGVDVSHLKLSERIEQCNIFCAAINKPFDSAALSVRCKRLFSLDQFKNAMNHLECKDMKQVKKGVTIKSPCRDSRNEFFYMIETILFIKEVKDPWMTFISKKTGDKYYYSEFPQAKPDGRKFLSLHELPPDGALDTMTAFSTRVVWPWEEAATAIFERLPTRGLSLADMETFIKNKTKS